MTKGRSSPSVSEAGWGKKLSDFAAAYFVFVAGIWNRHWPGFLKKFRGLLFLAALACTADALSTIHFLLHNPDLVETHPVIRVLCDFTGPYAGPILGKLGQYLALFLLSVFLRPIALYLLLTASLIYFYAAWYNIWGHELYTPLFLRLLHPLLL